MSNTIIAAPLEDASKKRQRSERFKDHLLIDTNIGDEEPFSGRFPSPKRLKGSSTALEKPYLRLTTAPKAASVRPLKVLKEALEHVKSKYLTEEDYSYACEQLKSIRQDLTVQHITNRFAAHVYETHARIALESGDLSEYNQCQSRLQEFRMKGVPISEDEFDCYKFLHAVLRDNKLELIGTLRALSNSAVAASAQKADSGKALSYALDVVKAARSGNVHKFFQLYKSSPHLSGYILDFMVLKMRQQYLAILLKGHLTVPVDFVRTELGFATEKECLKFLYDNSAVMRHEEESDGSKVYVVDCKKSGGGGSNSSSSSSSSSASSRTASVAATVIISKHQQQGSAAHVQTHAHRPKSQPTTSSAAFSHHQHTVTFSHGKAPASGGGLGGGGKGKHQHTIVSNNSKSKSTAAAAGGLGSKHSTPRDRGPIIMDSELLALSDHHTSASASAGGENRKKEKKNKRDKKNKGGK